MILTPGAYLRYRRTAAGLAIADVAQVIATDPKIAEHRRGEWLLLIEADAVPANWSTIVALRRFVPFDLSVLERLSLIAGGIDLRPPRLCRMCAAGDVGPPGIAVAGWIATDLCLGCAPLGLPIAGHA
ncbi:hypothetical protein ASG37_05050 [Sphingomonas sp. Leaf407]|uniref:hypothetical protein n=1 Tax=unclassified Sphingomonas TaxID=196159 RepID=UPI000701FFAD|nr:MULTISPECIES: hypothetical protein [unclassified Sphingomonas]KQN37030.1 hypothetical protein ASE97_10965 [Sphingomonas sp. Leaf42]KQT30457.1 hypothetical protein ASG37_05050 [Sphingomonas sp. Leaf407]